MAKKETQETKATEVTYIPPDPEYVAKRIAAQDARKKAAAK